MDTERLFATLDAITAQPEIARFQFRARNVAAARGVRLTEVELTLEGDIDLRGAFGLSKEVRNGYQGIRVTFVVRGDASPEKLREVVERAQARISVRERASAQGDRLPGCAGPAPARRPLVESVHDLLVASSRLARGDAAVAIGVNMHLIPVTGVAHRWRAAALRGDEQRARALGRSLERVSREGVVMAAAISEPHQDLTRPATTARRTAEGCCPRRKEFCTMSPAATLLYTAVTFEDEDGAERYGYAQVPADAPGVRMHDDWDALGMRASGSQSFPRAATGEALRGGFPAGRLTGDWMDRNLNAGAFHAAASVGIAEAAHDGVARGARLAGRRRGLAASPDPGRRERHRALRRPGRSSPAPARCSTSTHAELGRRAGRRRGDGRPLRRGAVGQDVRHRGRCPRG